MTPAMQLLSVNVGSVRRLMVDGRLIHSAIGKRAVAGPVAVGPLGLAGDEQADPTVHGGLDKAVYAYPAEHIPGWLAWRAAMGVAPMEGIDDSLPPGFMGENLTLHGLLETGVWVGDTLHFADCVLRVTQPREPCFKFNRVMGHEQAARRLVQTGHSGWYLAVDRPGTLTAGESFRLVPGARERSLPEALAGKRARHLR